MLKKTRIFDDFQQNRAIPACAGKRRQRRTTSTGWRDHPRVCGEKVLRVSQAWVARGSPPRVRGKALRTVLRGRRSGITPACAGKRICCSRMSRSARDHPRVCGEKPTLPPISRLKLGSPPRVRGKVQHALVFRHYGGITPACAGKSLPVWQLSWRG